MDLVIVHLSKTESVRNKEPKIDPKKERWEVKKKSRKRCKITFQLNSLSIKAVQNRAIFTNFKSRNTGLSF